MILYKVLLKLLLLWCAVISHSYPLWRDLDHCHLLPSIPGIHFIVQVSCTILVLYNGINIPVNNAYSI